MLIGKKAPNFEANAVVGDQIIDNFSLAQYKGKKNVIFFFYPLDFTFVCPTELHAFQEKMHEFEARNGVVVGCSVDSAFSHLAWVNTPRSKGGIQGVQYPLVSDLNKSIARDFNVLNETEGVAFRGLFLIDKEGIVRHQLVNDLPLGRSVDEVVRILEALNFYEANGEVCPANWKSGEKAMQPTQEGLAAYFN